MKVVCIDNIHSKLYDAHIDSPLTIPLTIDKQYEVLEVFDKYYRILDDTNTDWEYDKNYFITLEEHRNNQIDKVL